MIALSDLSFAGNSSSVDLWGSSLSKDSKVVQDFKESLQDQDYKKAIKIAKSKEVNSQLSSAMVNIVLWKKYSNDNFNPEVTSFSDISRFVNDNQFFPNLHNLRLHTEDVVLKNKVSYKYSRKYFSNFPPLKSESKVYFLQSEINYLSVAEKEENKKLSRDVQKLTVQIWVNEDFSIDEENKFLEKYSKVLTQNNHLRRIYRLLWEGKTTDAKRILYLVNQDYQKLFLAITKIDNKKNYINNIILSVPRKFRGDELLLYKTMMWKKDQIKDGDIEDLVAALLRIPENTKKPEKWWPLRKLYGRELLKQKNKKSYKKAYLLFANHGLKAGGEEFADAQWTAGWIALRFLGESKDAYRHFYEVYENVNYPISISRATYWLGMAAQSKGDKKEAIKWYKMAAQYSTYFYGQLAIHKHRLLDSVGSQHDIILPEDPEIFGEDIRSASNNMSVKVAYILSLVGEKNDSAKIFEYAIKNAKSKGEIAVIMQVVGKIGDGNLGFKVSKFAAKKNVFFIKDKFKIIESIQNNPEAPLVHAIIKQESGFEASALSSVGAVGFMQLMPDTAKEVCRAIGIPYSKYKLATNVSYNIKLGAFYIKSLVDRFDGSEILAIASYNAGPHNAIRWIEEFYDPRLVNDVDKVVDWIELITYSETRNYVQRIMENMIVYKYIMSRTNYDKIK